MKRSLLLIGAAAAALFAASGAQAAHVHWSVGIGLPPVVLAPPPLPFLPAPVVAPAPFYAPAPVVYGDPVVETVVAPRRYVAPVVVEPRFWAPPHRAYYAPRGGWDHRDFEHGRR